MNVIEKPLSEIKPYEKNPRMNDEAVDYVAESIKNYGFKVPLVIDIGGVIVTGHTRYRAAQKLGLKTVPVIVASDLTDEQIRAYRIADNKTSDYSMWDNKLLLEELEDIGDMFTGFDLPKLEGLGVLDETDNAVIEENEYGVTYEIVIRSEDKEKIAEIKKIWDERYNGI